MLASFTFVGVSLVSVAPASALDPAPPRIVFSNGGRIAEVNADGRGRQVLASRFKKVENTDFGYQEPVLSPDGSRIVFLDRRPDREYGYLENIMVMNADGTGMAKVLDGNGRNHYRAPSWTTDGERIIAGYHLRVGKRPNLKETGGILSVKADGTDQKIIYKPKGFRDRAGFPVTPRPDHPVMSPDGTKILFDDYDRQTDKDGRLMTLDLASGKTKAIGRYSLGGSWSPDGSKIVFSQKNTGGDEVCGSDDCRSGGELIVVNADGKRAKNLLPGKGHEMSPDWSEDGSRIVFAGNRNVPTSSDAYEIYSVRPDGSCLSWLTNGTPASVSPSWSVRGSTPTGPRSCGDNDLKTRPEVTLKPKVRGLTIQNWMGGDFQGQLYSGRLGPTSGEHFTALSYLDCSQFNPRRCGAGFTTLEFSTCYVGNSLTGLVGFGGSRRGVPAFMSNGDGTTQVGVYSGEGFFVVMHETNNRYFTNRQLLRGIRPFGSTSNPKKLPPPVFSARAIRKMNKVIRVQRRTGSVERTAEVLDMKPKVIRRTLKLKPALLKYGPIRTTTCPK